MTTHSIDPLFMGRDKDVLRGQRTRSLGQQQLRVGLVIDRLFERPWASDLVRAMKEMAAVDLGPVITVDDLSATREPPDERVLLRLWTAIDRMLFGRGSNGLQTQLRNELEFTSGRVADAGNSIPGSLSPSALETFQSANLDLLIQIGGEYHANELSRVAKKGSWWISEPAEWRSTLAWFWAMYEDRQVFETLLKAISPDGRQRILHRCVAAIDPDSLVRNKTSKQRKIFELLIGELSDLQQSTSSDLDAADGGEIPEYAPREFLLPTNLDLTKFLLRWAYRGITKRIERTFWREHWFVAYRSSVDSFPTSVDSMQGFQIVASASDRFYADPFSIKKGDKTYLFFEDYPFDKGKGIISYVEIDESSNYTTPQIALEREYHLSYPHVFEHAGEIYMLPESLETRRVDLYRALDFPQEWTLEKTLLDNVAAVDPTIFFHDGKVWLFVSGMRNEHCINEELFLFFSDSLTGDWTPHPANPIVSDVRRARPAGRIFVRDGQIIRPAQDCSTSYGRAVSFNRIDVLSETTYRETPVARIGPEWRAANRGTHTFNQSGKLQAVDGRVLIRRRQRKSTLRDAARKLQATCSSISSDACCDLSIRQNLSIRSDDRCRGVIANGQQEPYADGLIR